MEGTSSTEHEPELVARDALRGITVGLSVSDSADLSRLGLTPAHCELAVAELARAIFLAGGTIVYGGRLVPSGFTDILIDELRRYRDDRDALILCVPESEHRRFTNDELARRERELHASAELVCLDATGEPINITTRPDGNVSTDISAALTGMRRHITGRCDARVIVGGKLRGFQGTMPGVIEEAILSIQAGQPLYIAGGFGGAAAAVARALGRQDNPWYPPDFPDGADEQEAALAQLRAAATAMPPPADGLSDSERHRLAATHRPGDIAALVVTGLGRFAAHR
ncbi:MAG TPA: hypothetical protein VFP54_12575 [Acidimicrobiales bacterium]|nr:hypothetical protein [Acidimicrobiales bacterium]